MEPMLMLEESQDFCTFSRNNAVYNEEGKKVSYIGWEWDLEIYKYFTDSLKFSFKGAYFKPGKCI